ncbi:MAG TPA: 50S ribosomal protein L11 methyltransferase, partial [Bacillota bacterium]|nr:50S ribosomal protein L11 methyltransferase [Bacillota bacterium]
MIYNELTIHTNTAGAQPVADRLIALGVTYFVTQDPEDFKEFLHDKSVPWDYVDDSLMKLAEGESLQILYLSDSNQDKALAESVKNSISALRETEKGFGSLEITEKQIDDNDWANNWKQYFKPLEIGEDIVIQPSWEKYEGNRKTILELDPGSSFGTGQHETTALCLTALEQFIHTHKNAVIADIGCGSGILGIASLKLGAKSVAAVDIDENAVAIAQENAKKNGFAAPRFTAICGNVNENRYLAARIASLSCDLILANIVADVLIMMAPVFAASLTAGKTLICSGIIAEKKDAVISVLASHGFKREKEYEKNDWVTVVFTKK